MNFKTPIDMSHQMLSNKLSSYYYKFAKIKKKKCYDFSLLITAKNVTLILNEMLDSARKSPRKPRVS